MTLSGNTASSGDAGGILAESAVVDFKDSIVALNTASADSNCFMFKDPMFNAPALTSLGYNLTDSPDTCSFTATGDKIVPPSSVGLGPLANNGGPTETRALLAGSPAIDGGNPGGCTDPSGAPLTTDQRGEPRPAGAHCDIGAFEFQPSKPSPPSCSLQAASNKVLVKKPKGKKHKQAKIGVLTLTAACNQSATLTLSGKLTEQRNKHHTKHFNFGTHTYMITGGKTLTITLKLPGGAVKALAKHKKESAALTLAVSNGNGINTSNLKISKLKPRTL